MTKILVGSQKEMLKELQRETVALKNGFLVVTNRRIAGLYKNSYFEKIEKIPGYRGRFLIPDSERAKDIKIAQQLYDKLISVRLDRSSLLVAFGGGVCTDLTGFAASTYMRGIRWIAMPTTLLAQVDAAIGGKTAINHLKGKNLIGTFWHPLKVTVDSALLQTLGKKEIANGLAEMIKTGMIGDVGIISEIEKNTEKILNAQKSIIEPLIIRCIKIKARIVQEDERDNGRRNVLNFGHTIAHAIETHGRYNKISHGKAVALGMLFATNYAEKRSICETDTTSRLKALLQKVGIITDKIRLDPGELIPIMNLDKKRKDKKIRFVLPEKAGRVIIKSITPENLKKDSFWTI